MKPLTGSTRFDVSQSQGLSAAEIAAMAATGEDTGTTDVYEASLPPIDTGKKFPDDGAPLTRDVRQAMEDIYHGGTGEPPPPTPRPPPPQKTHHDLVLEVVTEFAPHKEVLSLVKLLDDAFERGQGTASTSRDDIVVLRDRLARSEARRQHEIGALLSDLQEMPGIRRKLGELATMVRVNESRAEFAERKLAHLEQSELVRMGDRGHEAGVLARTQEELTFAQGQIDTLHGEILKLQEANAALEQRLADAPKPASRSRRRKSRRRA